MPKFRILTSLCLAIVLLLTIYYVSLPRSDGYTDHWMRSDAQMLRADEHGSRVRFITSHSAGQYDVDTATHVGQEYEGVTRSQYILNAHAQNAEQEMDGEENASGEKQRMLDMPIHELLEWLKIRQEEGRLKYEELFGQRRRRGRRRWKRLADRKQNYSPSFEISYRGSSSRMSSALAAQKQRECCLASKMMFKDFAHKLFLQTKWSGLELWTKVTNRHFLGMKKGTKECLSYQQHRPRTLQSYMNTKAASSIEKAYADDVQKYQNLLWKYHSIMNLRRGSWGIAIARRDSQHIERHLEGQRIGKQNGLEESPGHGDHAHVWSMRMQISCQNIKGQMRYTPKTNIRFHLYLYLWTSLVHFTRLQQAYK